MQRIAQHCATTHPAGTPLLTVADRFEAALDAVVEYVAEHGWPDSDFGPLFRAGHNAVTRAADETAKHLARGHFWARPPGNEDSLAEAVTDKVAAWQIAWALTESEWAAVWALTEVMKRDGDWRDAAALIGISDTAMATRLNMARNRARGLWIAPGETPRPRFIASRDGRRSKAYAHRKYRRYRDRRTAA